MGGRFFEFNRRRSIMGVINLSADSWYRESVCLNTEMAVRRAQLLSVQGAEIIDLGAESTLAHAAHADNTLQNSKLLPVIEMLRGKTLISVETYNSEVARACLDAGANILNLTGRQETAELYALAQAHGAAVIICYLEGENVRQVGDFDLQREIIPRMQEYFQRQIALASKVGLRKLFLDPGMGFYYRNLQDSTVRVKYQMQTFLNTFRLRKLGFPICHALPHAFEFFGEEVRSAEPFFAVLAALGKTDLFRTHEVPKTKAVLDALQLL